MSTRSQGQKTATRMGSRIVEFDGKGKVVHQLKNIPWSVTSVSLMR